MDMQLTSALMAAACLLTYHSVPDSWLIFPGLAALSCVFLPDQNSQLFVLAAGMVFWLLKLRQESTP